MKLLAAILLTTFGTLSGQDAPLSFQLADKVYNSAKLAQSKHEHQEAAQLFVNAKDLFLQFITKNPDDPEVATAYYRSGVSDLITGNRLAAEEAFRKTLEASDQKGQPAASAAFRLGALAYNDEKFTDAASNFLLSKTETDMPRLKAQSLNYLARCYLQTKQTEKAQTTLEELVAFDDENNDYISQAKLTLAHLHATKDELAEAYQYYVETSRSADSEFKIQLISAGVLGLEWANELAEKEPEKAAALRKSSIQLLQEGLEIGGTDESKLLAQFHLMTHFASLDEHLKVIETFRKGSFNDSKPHGNFILSNEDHHPKDLPAKVLLLAAKSMFKEEQYNSSHDLCIRIAESTQDKTLLSEAAELKAKNQDKLGVINR